MKTMNSYKKTYGNGVSEVYITAKNTSKNTSKKRRYSSEENTRKELQKKRNRFKVLVNSNPKPLNYAFTFTSGIETERTDPLLLKKIVEKYLSKQNITYVLCVDISHPKNDKEYETEACSERGYHIHGLADKIVDFNEWRDMHNCTNKALYIDEIRHIDRYINYISRNCIQIHGIKYYAASFKKQEVKKEAEDIDHDEKMPPLSRYYKSDRYTPVAIVERFLINGQEPSISEIRVVFSDYLELRKKVA